MAHTRFRLVRVLVAECSRLCDGAPQQEVYTANCTRFLKSAIVGSAVSTWVIFLIASCGITYPFTYFYKIDSSDSIASKDFSVTPPSARRWISWVEPYWYDDNHFEEWEKIDTLLNKMVVFDNTSFGDTWGGGSTRLEQADIIFLSYPLYPDSNFQTSEEVVAAIAQRLSNREWNVRVNRFQLGERPFFQISTFLEGKLHRVDFVCLTEGLDRFFVILMPNNRKDYDNMSDVYRAFLKGFSVNSRDLAPAQNTIERAAEMIFPPFGNPGWTEYWSDRNSGLATAIVELKQLTDEQPESYLTDLLLGLAYIRVEGDAILKEWEEELGKGTVNGSRGLLGLCDFKVSFADGRYGTSVVFMTAHRDEAEAAFSMALSADSSSFWARYYLAGLFMADGKYELAVEQACDLVNLYPESRLAKLVLDFSISEAGDLDCTTSALTTSKKPR